VQHPETGKGQPEHEVESAAKKMHKSLVAGSPARSLWACIARIEQYLVRLWESVHVAGRRAIFVEL
jgi:hypothetical protein